MPNNTPAPVRESINRLEAPYNSCRKKYSDNTIKQTESMKGKNILVFIVRLII
jgi:hypothetical protein